MKKIQILSLGLLALVFAGCDLNEMVTRFEAGTPVVFTANTVAYAGLPTRTVYSGKDQDNNPMGSASTWERIDWVNGDLIRVWCEQEVSGGNYDPASTDHFADYRVKSHEMSTTDKKQSIATLENVGVNGLTWSADKSHTFYALYPSPATEGVDDTKVKLEGNVISAITPASQTVTLKSGSSNFYEPSMAKYGYMWAAKQSNPGVTVDLGFKPLMTAFEFNLINNTGNAMEITSFSMSSGDGQLAGEFTATVGTDMTSLTVSAPTNANNTVTVGFGGNVTLADQAGITFTLFTLPQNPSQLTIHLTTTAGTKNLKLQQMQSGTMTWIPFTGCKKYRITNLKVGEIIEWDVTYDVLSMGHEVAYDYTGSNITSNWAD